MDNQELWNKLMDLSLIVGMNQRYAQHHLSQAEWRSSSVDLAVMVFTVLTLALGVAAYFSPKLKVWSIDLDLIAVFSSIPAAVVGIALMIVPFGKDVRHYGEMYQGWGDLRIDVDAAIEDCDHSQNADYEALERRYRDLLTKKNNLNLKDSGYKADEALLEKFLAQEEASRGVKVGKVSLPGT